MSSQKKSLELIVETGQPWDGARHLSGQRRSGLPAPDCPVCKAPMFCIFSIDGRDEILEGSPLEVAEIDYDLFVCGQLCYPYQTGYFTQVNPKDGTVQIIYMYEGPDHPIQDVVLPYPIAPLRLEELANQATPDDEEIDRLLCRQIAPGYYHRICPYFLWGGEGKRGLKITEYCQFCGGMTMEKAMTIDSDENLGITVSWGKGASRAPLMWGDQNYLGVTHCRRCKAFGYRYMT